ncbi:hypothetical protein HY949_03720, partial [Candidatus Gottesmanbacteria bacterium]|nr:hypothetical protein [Candidatus Gottesmanbacteria bacterium]
LYTHHSPLLPPPARAVEGTLTISGSSQTLTGDITAARIVDSANSAYFIDPAATGTSGTALTNLESRPVGQHNHSVDPASTSVSITDPGHSHHISQTNNSSGGNYYTSGGGSNCIGGCYNTNTVTTGISASVDIAAFNSANSGSVAGTNAPYIQLLACQKS